MVISMTETATNYLEIAKPKQCELDSLLLENDVRESMKRDLSDWLQPFLTHLTAKPYQGEKPRQRTALNHVYTAFLALFMGVSITSFAVFQSSFYPLLIPLGWSLTINGLRKLRLTIMHYSSHYAIFKNRRLNDYLGFCISILTLTLNFKAYQKGHVKTHHSKNLMLPGDETYDYLINTVGFRRGMTLDEARKHLQKTLISPDFYVRRVLSRFRQSFFSDSWVYNAVSFAFHSSILAIIAVTNSWLIFLIAWVIPLLIFFEISILLRQCVEHRFPRKDVHSQDLLTLAIFCGEHTPNCDQKASWIEKFSLWLIWWFRLFFYHLPSRAFVLMGDTPCHDFHHHYPGSLEWGSYIFERQKNLETETSQLKYQHNWGLLEAINETFKSLAIQD